MPDFSLVDKPHFCPDTVFHKGNISEIALDIRKMHMITVKYMRYIFVQDFVVAERSIFNNDMPYQ